MINPVDFFNDPYWGRAEVLVTHDGDSFYLFIDNKRRNFSEEWIRLHMIDTWELKQPMGVPAMLFAALWFADHRHRVKKFPFVFHTDKDKLSFNRYIAKIWCSQGHGLEEALRENGFEKL